MTTNIAATESIKSLISQRNLSATELIDFGRSIIREEASVLVELAERLDAPFAGAIQALLECPTVARVLVTGMGKAGHIGKKVSATLASIGISSFFINAAEAAHGDFGRFRPHDIILVFSNSGETPEVVALLDALQELKANIIAITRHGESTLARAATHTITIGNIVEAGPLNLAPTSSTVAMAAVGDALCMTLLAARGFTEDEFHRYHPGGDLGRKLLRCRDIMRTGECHCVVLEETPAGEVFHRYSATKGRPGAATIVDDKGVLTGIFTDGDVRRLIDHRRDFFDLPIREVMSRKPKSILESAMAREALDLITQYKIDQVVVVNSQGQAVGLIDIQDLVQVFASVLPSR